MIGQSLGGAVATLFATDYPEDVAGLLLLDPTPINDPKLASRVETTMRRLERFSHVPIAGRSVQGLLRSTARKSSRRHEMTPEVKRALFASADADLPQLARAVVGLGDIARTFDESRLPRIPSIVVTADRPESSTVRKAHARLAAGLGAELITWPGAEHHVHLSHQTQVLDAAANFCVASPRTDPSSSRRGRRTRIA